jgi:hypothetical protein
MSGKWTPGPWRVNRKAATNVEADNGRQIRGVAACGGYYDNTSNGAWATENEANAHLIAAAPDMAKALIACISASTPDERTAAIDAALAALAKARGEAP